MKGSICDRHLRRHIKNSKCYFVIFTEIKEADAANKNFVTSAAKSITIVVKNIIDRVRTVRQRAGGGSGHSARGGPGLMHIALRAYACGDVDVGERGEIGGSPVGVDLLAHVELTGFAVVVVPFFLRKAKPRADTRFLLS